jgi:acyl carrier protein
MRAGMTQSGQGYCRESRELPLKFFVMYSSVSSLHGNAGQTNYSSANAYLDWLVEHRNNQGLPGLSIQWGAWNIEGSMASPEVLKILESQGILSIDEFSGYNALDYFFHKEGVVGFMPVKEKKISTRQKHQLNIPEGKEKEFTDSVILSTLKEIIGDSAEIDTSLPFMEMGLDSLTAIEFRQSLIQKLENSVELSTTVFFDFPTFEQLSKYIVEHGIFVWKSFYHIICQP